MLEINGIVRGVLLASKQETRRGGDDQMMRKRVVFLVSILMVMMLIHVRFLVNRVTPSVFQTQIWNGLFDNSWINPPVI